MFLDDASEENHDTHVYFPREFRYDRLIELYVHLGEDTGPGKRLLRPGRYFYIFENGTWVGAGRVLPWDTRWLDIAEASERVTAFMKTVFEPLVWFGGVQELVKGSPSRGFKAEASTEMGPVKMLVYTIAGRCLIQLETGITRVTVIADESSPEPRSGIQGINATEADAIRLLKVSTEAWKAGSFQLQPDEKVGLG